MAKNFTEKQLYSMVQPLSSFLAFQIKNFRELNATTKIPSTPMDISLYEWDRVLGEMIFAFENFDSDSADDQKRVKKGLFLFAEYYRDLWI